MKITNEDKRKESSSSDFEIRLNTSDHTYEDDKSAANSDHDWWTSILFLYFIIFNLHISQHKILICLHLLKNCITAFVELKLKLSN